MDYVGDVLQAFDHAVKHFRVLHVSFEGDRNPVGVL